MNSRFEKPKSSKADEPEKQEWGKLINPLMDRLQRLTKLLRLTMAGVYIATTPANVSAVEANNSKMERTAHEQLINNYLKKLERYKNLSYRKPGEAKSYDEEGNLENADCSDLVNEALELPYEVSSNELYRRYAKNINSKDAQKGDLIFWMNKKGKVYHVATILKVLEDDKFITFEITSDDARYPGDVEAYKSGQRTRDLRSNHEIARIDFGQVKYARNSYQASKEFSG